LPALEAPCFFFFFFLVLPLRGFAPATEAFFDGPHRVLDVVFGHVRVPDVQCAHRGELGHP
jgi:hypothetical protein